MAEFLQLVVSGIATGAIYAVAALGFTLMWQAAGVINFAQGEFVMLPAFGMLMCIGVGMPLWLAFLVTCVAAALVLGYAFKRGIADPLIHHGVIPLVIATLGVSIAAKSFVRSGYSAMAQQFPSPFPEGVFHVAGVTVSFADAGTLVIAGAIVLSLQAFLNRTVTGRAMQAVAQNTESARVLGIDVSRMVLYVFVINALLACVAALLITPIYLAKFDMGETIGTKAFFAAIIGGFNQTRGALLGGVLIGVMENVVGYYLSPAYKEGVALVLFLLVILFRPEGILGRREERKV
ncbi:MAG TPA: branched-chain amino acid ABC transporter permease [Casimicrobiaceae bacterium]|jgi:branched-chain amino acid transport system permease protein|nr:branched-chain amino acid ABC transporter permease [Casimicrobiaceae bacterium]